MKATSIIEQYIHEPEFRHFIMEAQGCSMQPAVVAGDKLYMERLEKPPSVGDVILCQGHSGRFYLHRVVESGERIVTRGDASPDCDEPIKKTFAKLVKIKKTPITLFRRARILIKGIIRV